MTIRQLFEREHRCSSCYRVVPREEKREGPYALGDGRQMCLACVVVAVDQADAQVTDERLRRATGDQA